MKLFRHFRSKSKAKAKNRELQKHHKIDTFHNDFNQSHPRYGSRPARDYTQNLPPHVLSNIFTYVCPHSLDASLNSSEESMTEDGCMLCDMRDLAHAALVCSKWYGLCQKLLYQHVRIDAVHYCELEIILAAKRKKNSFMNHNAEPLDAPRVRLLLFMRTVRETRALGTLVHSLRMPFMTREASKGELARTVSVLPNLRYVDLPAGFFSDDVSSQALKQELMARCLDIRRMKYTHGAEANFSHIPNMRGWGKLEVLELNSLSVEVNLLRMVLHTFSNLQDLRMEDMPRLDDSGFKHVPSLHPFPPIQRLTLTDAPQVTSQGLLDYLSTPQNRDALKHLSVANTGIQPQALHDILSQAPSLSSLSIIQEVTRGFPPDNIPPLTSKTLRLLHFEITSETGSYGIQPVSASYYTYLMSSLLSGSLPSLTDLYVRDSNFPETLMLTPPPKLFGGGDSGPQLPAGMGLNQDLSVYSKGIDELEWNFTTYEPFAVGGGRPTSVTRPLSFHGAQLSPAWGGDARRSVLVGNGFGGFLAVPADEERPKSSGGWSISGKGKQDLWR